MTDKKVEKTIFKRLLLIIEMSGIAEQDKAKLIAFNQAAYKHRKNKDTLKKYYKNKPITGLNVFISEVFKNDAFKDKLGINPNEDGTEKIISSHKLLALLSPIYKDLSDNDKAYYHGKSISLNAKRQKEINKEDTLMQGKFYTSYISVYKNINEQKSLNREPVQFSKLGAMFNVITDEDIKKSKESVDKINKIIKAQLNSPEASDFINFSNTYKATSLRDPAAASLMAYEKSSNQSYKSSSLKQQLANNLKNNTIQKDVEKLTTYLRRGDEDNFPPKSLLRPEVIQQLPETQLKQLTSLNYLPKNIINQSIKPNPSKKEKIKINPKFNSTTSNKSTILDESD